VLAAARVASAVIGGRTFGAVDTLASLSLVLLPWLLSRRA
jgi:hypothetical protein